MPRKKGEKPVMMERLEEENKGFEQPPNQSQEVLNFYIDRLKRARDERAMNRKEFDGSTFELDYERNRETLFSFLRPKKNDDDVRVNSGTAEKKIELMLNELISMNFQPEIRAYDKNSLALDEMSRDLTDMVRKTNDQETDDDVWQELYQDLLSQRIAFGEERIEEEEPDYAKKSGLYTRKYACKRRLSPLQVYVADMYLPAYRLQEQPYIVIYDRMLYEEGEQIYGENENWKYVKPGTQLHEEYAAFFKFRFSTLRDREIEVITILTRVGKKIELMRIINGVMMYAPKTYINRPTYPIFCATVKSIPDFFYGKPPIASAKYLQALNDETIRNLIRKMRQAIEPPLGVQGSKTYSRDIWQPAAVTQGLTGQTFSKLIEHDGVSNSEFQMMQLIKQMIEEFVGQGSINTPPGAGAPTATQILELQKQGLKMLGLAVVAIMRMKRDATFLRIDSFLREYMNPVGKREVEGKIVNEYRKFEIEEGRAADGEIVKKYITLLERRLSDEEMRSIRKEEKRLEKQTGDKVRYSFLNVVAMQNFPMDFKVVVTPESRDSGSLDKVLFQDRLNQAAAIAQMTGRQLNGDKVVEDFERTWKVRDMFSDGMPMLSADNGDPAVQAQAKDLMKKMGGGTPQQSNTGMPQPQPMGQSEAGSQIGKTMSNLAKR